MTMTPATSVPQSKLDKYVGFYLSAAAKYSAMTRQILMLYKLISQEYEPDVANDAVDEIVKRAHPTAQMLAALDQFDKKASSVATLVSALSELFSTIVPLEVLARANQLCETQKKRKLTYVDLAVCYYVHRMHVERNLDNSSPVKGIVKYSERLVTSGKILESPLSTYHVSVMLRIFSAARLTKKVKEENHAAREAAVWGMIPNVQIDAIWCEWSVPDLKRY